MQPHKLQALISKEVQLQHLLHAPQQVHETDGEQWPAILFLHGLDESGDDPHVLLNQGLPQYVSAHPGFPFVVIAPQCPRNTWWPELEDGIGSLIEEYLRLYPIDRKRLYLTGLSMGGYGAWYYGVTWPDLFAAIVPNRLRANMHHGPWSAVCRPRSAVRCWSTQQIHAILHHHDHPG